MSDSVPDGFEDDLRELRELFLTSRRGDLAKLAAALAAGDLDGVRAVGHVFKGSCLSFGYAQAGRLGAALEDAARRGDHAAAADLAARLEAAMAAGPDAKG